MNEYGKRQGFVFPVQDKNGNFIHNIFIDTDGLDKGEEYKEVLSAMNEILYEIFPRNKHRIEIRPAFDFENIEGKYISPKPHIFFIELFYNSEDKFNVKLFKKIVEQIKDGKTNYLPSLTPGAVTRGVDFYNQEKFIQDIWNKLEKKHIILTAPRRFGKTSILFNLLDNPKEDFCPVHFDFENISNAPSFVTEIIVGLKRNKWADKCKEIYSAINGSFKDGENEQARNKYKEDLKAQINENWQEKWREISNALSKSSLKILFILDEFSYMLENFLEFKRKFEEEKRLGTRDKESLDKLEKEASCKLEEGQNLISILHQTITNSRNSRFILTGSTLIKRVFKELEYEYETEFLKMFLKKRLECLREKDSYEFVKILLSVVRIRPKKEIAKGILKLIGSPIPFFIQLLIQEIEKGILRERENKKIELEDIKKVYQERLIGIECKIYFKDYYEHLKHYVFSGPYSMPGIKTVFWEIASGERNSKNEIKAIFKDKCQRYSDDDFERLLEYLEDEFYLKKKGNKYVFANNVMKDWWLRHSQYMD